MTTVYPISSATAAADRHDADADRPATTQLNQDTFLKLLVAQMKYQDPMIADRQHAVPHADRAVHRGRARCRRSRRNKQAHQHTSQLLAASGDDRPAGHVLAHDRRRAGDADRRRPSCRSAARSPKDAPVGTHVDRDHRRLQRTSGTKIPLELEFTQDRRRLDRAGVEQRAKPSASPSTSRSTRPASARAPTSRSRPPTLDGIVGHDAATGRPTGITLAFGDRERSDPPRRSPPGRRPSPSPNRTATTARPRPASSPASTSPPTVRSSSSTASTIPYTSVTDVQSQLVASSTTDPYTKHRRRKAQHASLDVRRSLRSAAHQTFMDVVGNNIANVNTTGYKTEHRARSRTCSASNARRRARRPRTSGGTNPAQVGLGVRLTGISMNFAQGATQLTGRSTDFAIQGDGFFVVDQGGIQRVHAQRQLLARRSRPARHRRRRVRAGLAGRPERQRQHERERRSR